MKGEELDKILGLEFGVDDYIIKLFLVRELFVRVKVVFRRINMFDIEDEEVYDF